MIGRGAVYLHSSVGLRRTPRPTAAERTHPPMLPHPARDSTGLHNKKRIPLVKRKTLQEQTMKTIFLVDDSATILLSISNILSKAGFAVEKAPNAEEALKKFQAGVTADLLITDLNMPGMNGIQLIREVRKLPKYKFMPILFLTTESQQEKRAEAKAAGASGWLVKPASADQLLNTIKLVLR